MAPSRQAYTDGWVSQGCQGKLWLRHRAWRSYLLPTTSSNFLNRLIEARSTSAMRLNVKIVRSPPQFPSSWAFSFQSVLPALLAYWPTGVLRFAFEGLQHVGEASLMVFIDRAIGCNDDHARQARRAERPKSFAVQID